jgi:G protein beta subunit-like protein
MSVILATAGQDDKIRFWEAPSGNCSRVLRYADSQVNCLEITTDKQYLAAGGNPHIRLFEINNPSNQNPILCLEGHAGNVTSLGFQRNGRYLYSGSEDGTVKLWDLRSPTYSRSFDSKGAVNSVALHPNQAEIISGDQNGSLKIFDLGSAKIISDIIPDPSDGTSSSSSSTSSHGRVAIQSVDVSGDSRILIAANNHAEVFVWNPNEASFKQGGSDICNKTVTKFRAHSVGAYLTRAKLSPDCRSLVTTSSDKTARLFDTTSWQLSQTLVKHHKWVWDAVFSTDSSYLVTASSDRSSLLWNLRTGNPVRQYTDHDYAVTCVALNDSST